MAQITAELLKSKYGLTVESVFVAFSQSRNKDQKNRSLNWVITLKMGDREILKTDYSAGTGHCPAYKRSAKELNTASSHVSDNTAKHLAIEWETECGKEVKPHSVMWNGRGFATKTEFLQPDPASVVYSLVMDSDAIDYASFEDWADNYGYDRDSRQGEAIYRACLELALKFRAGVGNSFLESLKELFQDY